MPFSVLLLLDENTDQELCNTISKVVLKYFLITVKFSFRNTVLHGVSNKSSKLWNTSYLNHWYLISLPYLHHKHLHQTINVIYVVCLMNHFISLKTCYIQQVIVFFQSPTSSAGKDSTIIGKCQTWSVSAWSMGLSAVELCMYLLTKQTKQYKINYSYKSNNKWNKWDKHFFIAFSVLCCYSLF